MADLGWIDWTLLAVLTVSMLIGLMRGFVFEIMSLAGWLVAWFGAQWLRFNFDAIPTPFLQAAQQLLPLVLVVHAACYVRFGLYRGVWRFASMPDLVRICKAVVTGTLICWALVALAAQDKVNAAPRQYLNRLSDLMFVLARVLNRARLDGLGGDDVYWKSEKLARDGDRKSVV